ncbi:MULTISPECIES: MFS transporter [unclassified Janthinobacterium]|uniref:MFS transporter n=1 Tax=unclassified Janthinobacterium TaxID=2610881 RepID=UPI000889AE9A|nr:MULTISPECIES: MFS transporter [unclassified Janthinobacterium]SDA55228.1 MFS transporter, MHS family, proline/betaine transporter [Janthinobacterium sp. 551a]SFB46837.1 MFS transporter, MHS family, proline/betaine transporter [Janthinobacterium sp. 344]
MKEMMIDGGGKGGGNGSGDSPSRAGTGNAEGAAHAAIVHDPKASRRAVIAASTGNALEWYDFTVYALFAVYIGQNFFQNENPTVQLMASFMAFGLGYVARPLGALLLGSYGDRAGRKAALTMTIMLMALGTLLIAIAPPYAAIGVGAPLLIVCGRVLQGFSAGGEIGGATAFLVEHAPPEKKGQYASWLQASMGISNVAGALVATVVTTIYTVEEIGEWAWRIPFIIGLAIAPVGLWMRKALDETPHFKLEEQRMKAAGVVRKTPLLQVLRECPKQLATGFGLSVLWAAAPYSLIIFMPIYAQKTLGFTASQAFTASLIGNLFMIVCCVLAGTLSDRLGRRAMLRFGAILLLVCVYPLMMWLQASHTTVTLVIVQSLFCAMIAMFVGVAPAALSEIFPTSVRSSGMSLSYNTAVTLLGGFAPAILTWITYTTGVAFAPALYVMGAAAVALVAISTLPDASKS